jgi:hypothetical protein
MKFFKFGALAVALAALWVASAYWDVWMVRPELRKSVLVLAKDPDLAQFRNETIYQRHMCGEVNQRNQYGGDMSYTGYKRFISTEFTYTIEGDGKMGLNPGAASTEDLIEELEWKTQQLKAGAVVSDVEAASRRFNRLWSQFCQR